MLITLQNKTFTESLGLEKPLAECRQYTMPNLSKYYDCYFNVLESNGVKWYILNKEKYTYDDGEHFHTVGICHITHHRKGRNKGNITIHCNKIIPFLNDIYVI